MCDVSTFYVFVSNIFFKYSMGRSSQGTNNNVYIYNVQHSPAVLSIARVEFLKILGVTVSRKFSVTRHITNLLSACAQTFFALRTLRHHGLLTNALHAVFQATVVAKLSYASLAWWRFTNAVDRNLLEAFLRRAARLD